MKKRKDLIRFLDRKVKEYNQPGFIKNDPLSIPRSFSKKTDIEIAGFFAAIFAWGNRTTIIQKTKSLMALMDNSPYAFITQHEEKDLLKLIAFKHRTFNDTDLLYFINFLRSHYKKSSSLESAFTDKGEDIQTMLTGFHHYFFSLDDFPARTKKHIATPERNSTCKRLNMYLRWMVRNDDTGVDFGIWKKISPSQLICPVDIHVARVARHFNILDRKQTDWQTAMELTNFLRELDEHDPVKYDFALFSLGAIEKMK